MVNSGAGEVAQWLRAVTVFAEGKGGWGRFIPSPHVMTHKLLKFWSTGIGCLLLASADLAFTWCTECTQAKLPYP